MSEGLCETFQQKMLALPRKLKQKLSFVPALCPGARTPSLAANSALQHMRSERIKQAHALCLESDAEADGEREATEDKSSTTADTEDKSMAGLSDFAKLMLKAWRGQRAECRQLEQATDEHQSHAVGLSVELRSVMSSHEAARRRRVLMARHLEQFVSALHELRDKFEEQYDLFNRLLKDTDNAEMELDHITDDHFNFEILQDYCMKDLLRVSDIAVAIHQDCKAMVMHTRRLGIAHQQLSYELIDAHDIEAASQNMLDYYDTKVRDEVEQKQKLQAELLLCQCQESEMKSFNHNTKAKSSDVVEVVDAVEVIEEVEEVEVVQVVEEVDDYVDDKEVAIVKRPLQKPGAKRFKKYLCMAAVDLLRLFALQDDIGRLIS